MLELEHGVTGIALNLEEDNVGVALFGEWEKVSEGETVKRTGQGHERPGRRRARRPDREPARRAARRRRARSRRRRRRPLEFKAPGVVNRQPVKEPLQTGHQGDRLDDPDRPRPARARDRRPLDGQDGDPDRHDPEPAGPGHDLHLRRDRPEGLDGRAGLRAPQGGGGDGLHDHRHGLRHRGGADQVDGALRGLRDGRALPLLRQARRLHVRRPLQARGRVPADVAAPAPPAGPRGLPGRRLLPPLAPARARLQALRRARRRLPDRAAGDRDPGRRRRPPTSRRTSSRSRTARSSSSPTSSTRACGRRSTSASPSRAWAGTRRRRR